MGLIISEPCWESFSIYLTRNLRSFSTTDRRWTCCSQDSRLFGLISVVFFTVFCFVFNSGVWVRLFWHPVCNACRRWDRFSFCTEPMKPAGRERPTVVRKSTPAELELNEEESTRQTNRIRQPPAHTALLEASGTKINFFFFFIVCSLRPRYVNGKKNAAGERAYIYTFVQTRYMEPWIYWCSVYTQTNEQTRCRWGLGGVTHVFIFYLYYFFQSTSWWNVGREGGCFWYKVGFPPNN